MDEPSKIQKAPRRTRLVAVRLTDAEYARLQGQAEAASVDMSTLARAVLLDEAIPSSARKATSDEKQLARMLAQLGKIGGNANQLARHANTTGDPASIAAVEKLWEEVAALSGAIREALNK